MNKQWRLIATAIMFLTRIPVGNAGSGRPEDLAASTQYFPLVGVIVGAVASFVFWLSHLVLSNNIAVVLALVAATLITGAFHEDGLADVADSAGAWTKEKKLDIMRDSRIGTYGGLALILASLLTAMALIDISSKPNSVVSTTATLILAHVLGRWSSLAMIYMTNYARDDSANKIFVDGVNLHRLLIGSLIALIVIVVSYIPLNSSAFVAAFASLVVMLMARHWFLKQFGGITGDCLGAANKCVEISVYLSIAATLSL